MVDIHYVEDVTLDHIEYKPIGSYIYSTDQKIGRVPTSTINEDEDGEVEGSDEDGITSGLSAQQPHLILESKKAF